VVPRLASIAPDNGAIFMAKEYCPIDLVQHPEFKPLVLRSKNLVVIPSQGEKGTKIITGEEGEMLYEHRQEAEGMGDIPGVFASRVNLPEAEEKYRQELFGESRPKWVVPNVRKPGVPLDQIILSDPGLVREIGVNSGSIVYGFNQTNEMAEIACRLGIKYYGNPDFAGWAGNKIGLSEFLDECGLPTPLTFSLHQASQLHAQAVALDEAGYKKLVVKVGHSTGGMGHLISGLAEVVSKCKDDPLKYLPSEFMPEEGAVVQGWVDGAVSVSLATFVEFDGSYAFTGAQAHLVEGQSALGAIGAMPIEEKYLDSMLPVGYKLAQGYIRHQAWGPHTMGMLIPTPEESERLGFPIGIPLCNDENSRPGASTISKAWILALREGRYGIGWVVSKIKVPKGTKISHVIEKLQSSGLLIEKTGSDAQGVFVFNGSVLDLGYEDKFYAVAISAKDDPLEAAGIMKQVKEAFL